MYLNENLFIEDLDIDVNIEELNATIKTLKTNKSGGNDGIINEFSKIKMSQICRVNENEKK